MNKHLLLELEKKNIFTENCIEFAEKSDSFVILKKIEKNIERKIFENKNYEEILEKMNLPYISTKNIPSYRAIVGYGEESIFETSLTVHHTYGCPYIRASTIKGMFRVYLEKIFLYEFEIKGKKINVSNKKDILLNILFGTNDNTGLLIFFDSFPVGKFEIVVDNIAPHYKEYYSEKGKIPPYDGKAVPINFFAVENTIFKFFIAANSKCLSSILKESISKNLLTTEESVKLKKLLGMNKYKKIIKKIFSDALFYEGLGAKTSSGYGAMIEVKK